MTDLAASATLAKSDATMRYVNKMTEYRKAIEVANEAEYEDPPWIYTPVDVDVKGVAQQAIDVYLEGKKPNGTIEGVGWWQCANGYTAIALKELWTGDGKNYDTLVTLLRQCEKTNPGPGLVNKFNDDSCWWAMCCMYVYAIRGDTWFLDQARLVWRYMRKSMLEAGEQFFKGEDMEGAVYWTSRPREDHINAISTGLFAELSARLALVDPCTSNKDDPSSEEYLHAAYRSLGWILRCEYRAHEGVVLDHIELKEQKAVNWIFTYNAGVALGTAALLYEATGEEEHLTLACYMAYKAMTRKGWVESNGILTEPGAYGRGKHDPLKDNDAVGFKSVLIRQLSTLYDVIIRKECALPRARRTAAMIHSFLYINFHGQLERNTDHKGRYGPWWAGPFESPTAHSQMAALDVMAGAVLVNLYDGKEDSV